MRSAFVPLGAFLTALAIAAGAFGAHALQSRLDARNLQLWETAARYLFIGAVGLLATGILAELHPARGWLWPGIALTVGLVIFSGTVFALALGAPRWLGAVTPIGGVLLIGGYLVLALLALRR
jgi:uncharacterized membrane protein YgdD (TMEM256/DUF423 family)